MDAQPCTFDGCDQVGVFATDDGPRCFVHAPAVEINPDDAETVAANMADDAIGFAEDVVAGLAAIILDHTAMTLTGTETAADDAMRSLAEATAMPLDFAAGVLLATSWIVACGDVTDEQITEGSERFERQAEGSGSPFHPDAGADALTRCPFCGDTHTAEDHETLYPLPAPEADQPSKENTSDDNVNSA